MTEHEKRLRAWWQNEFAWYHVRKPVLRETQERRAHEDLLRLARDIVLTTDDEALVWRAVEALWKIWEEALEEQEERSEKP